MQYVDRCKRQRQLADLRPELTDGLGRPELQKVSVPPKAPARPELHELEVTPAALLGAGARSMRTSPLTVFT